MSLKAQISQEGFDKLSDVEQSHYAEPDDGALRLLQVDSVKGFELTNAGNLRTALSTERTRANNAEQSLKAFEGIDDPDVARDAMAKVGELAEWDPEQKLSEAKTAFEKQLSDKFEKDRAALAKKHAKEAEDLGVRIESLTGQLSENLIGSAAAKAIAEAKGNPYVLLPLIKSLTRMNCENGKMIVEVLDEGRNPRFSAASGSTDPMTIDELVAELKRDEHYAGAFEGTSASGSGATGGGGTGGDKTSFRITEAEARDPATYRAAKESADKAGKQLQIAG